MKADDLDHILLFQYGDYAAAWRSFAAGGAETYRDQKASVDFVARLAGRFKVTTLSICDRPHREELAPHLWSIGIPPRQAYSALRVMPLLQELSPDLLILRTPHRHALLWARGRRVPTLPIFADIFTETTLRQRLENRLIRWTLSGPHVPCVCNHSLNASQSLRTCLDLPPERIVPWDRAPLKSDPEPKTPNPPGQPFRAFYAGLVSTEKGIGDCLQALARVAAQTPAARIAMDFAGTGDLDHWRAEAAALGLSDQVRFLGNLPNEEVRARMRSADVVLVPSRHDYAEGLPNTLCEALAARTPVVISDHPAFASRLVKDRDCLVFPAADPAALAAALQRLQRDPGLRQRLSNQGPAALKSLHFGLDWFALMRKFIEDPTGSSGWVARNSLAALTARRGQGI